MLVENFFFLLLKCDFFQDIFEEISRLILLTLFFIEKKLLF